MDLYNLQLHTSQAYFTGQQFAAIHEKLDWIGKKLDGEEMETSYNDIIIRQTESLRKELEEKIKFNESFNKVLGDSIFGELSQTCCSLNKNT